MYIAFVNKMLSGSTSPHRVTGGFYFFILEYCLRN